MRQVGDQVIVSKMLAGDTNVLMIISTNHMLSQIVQ